jgi:ERCC4-type nuclease
MYLVFKSKGLLWEVCLSKVKPLYTTLNPKSGQSAPWRIDIPDGLVMVIESDEQLPLFLQHGSICKSKDYDGELLTTRRTLPIGDYSIKGFEHYITFERKKGEELYSCLVDPLWTEREKAKFTKISRWAHKWLVIENSEADVLRFQDYSKVSPNFIRSRLAELELRLRIPIYYADGRNEAERFILYRASKFYRLKREGEI